MPAGEPWQRGVLLKALSPAGGQFRATGVTLERWQQRRMLRAGRCHFCCL